MPFLRSQLLYNYRKNTSNTMKTAKLIVWSSDFQINGLRLTRHCYIDGIFSISPAKYYKLLTMTQTLVSLDLLYGQFLAQKKKNAIIKPSK